MNVYEFMTPSDAITFKAEDDKIAFATVIFLAEGTAGCKRIGQDGKEHSLPCMLMFHPDPKPVLDDFVGMDFKEYANSLEVRTKTACAMKSFAYTKLSNRKEYDDKLDSFSTAEEKAEFMKKHEDEHRTSMTKWVLGAWEFGDNIMKRIEQDKKL